MDEVAKRVPSQQFRAWLQPMRILQFSDSVISAVVPSELCHEWVLEHYKSLIESVTEELSGARYELKLSVEADSLFSGLPLRQPSEIAETSLFPEDTNANGSSTVGQVVPLLNHSSGNPPSPSRDSLEEGLLDLRADVAMRPNSQKHSGVPTGATQPHGPGQPLVAHSPSRTIGQVVDPKHSFDTFVVGASNQFAHAAARAVAEQPATQYNPLFLYSDAGLGKTHLLHAIGNYALRINPKAKICYISAEKFVNDLIDSIHHGRMSAFRERYRDSYDMLLMDDIQFLAGKDRTQEEFFHTFNALHSSRRQIVVTSDKKPKDIPGLEDRIRTRFEWGLIADIQPPEIETRIAILRAKAERDDIFLPNDVAVFLASNIKTNIRELEGTLIRLGAQASLSGSEITLDLARQLLKSIINEPSTTVTPDSIIEATCRYYGVKSIDLKGKERSKRIAWPRQVAMYLVRKYTNKSYPEIGWLLGGKDHTTVLHGTKTVASLVESDPAINQQIEEIQNLL